MLTCCDFKLFTLIPYFSSGF